MDLSGIGGGRGGLRAQRAPPLYDRGHKTGFINIALIAQALKKEKFSNSRDSMTQWKSLRSPQRLITGLIVVCKGLKLHPG